MGMGFGLHAGWAIEGAVGSIHKVDATYLSPHVNMAARLETSSRQYGVPILISQNAYVERIFLNMVGVCLAMASYISCSIVVHVLLLLVH